MYAGQWPFRGYYPGKYWSWLWVRILLLPVKVEGREHLKKNRSYVFVANHQGAFDIFLIYGFLGRNFKWMMKKGLRKVPLIGIACEYAHHIFVDKSGPSKIRASYDRAREVLKEGMSLVVFPEASAVRLRGTWVCSAAVLSCLPMNCSCRYVRLPSMAVLM